MRAAVITTHGGPEVLSIQDVPDPAPGPEEIVVAVASSALNRADILQRMGLYPGPPAEYEIPGLEFAGTVTEVGERARQWAIGDLVMGITAGSAHADLVAIHERQVLKVPESLALAEAGAVPEVFLTAWDALVVQGGLTAGRWALVHAGASGVGTASIQLAKAMGANIIVTASTSKVTACKDLGADVVVDYTQDDFVEAVADATSGRGVDTVLDVIGGEYLNRNINSVAVGGSIVQVGVMGGGRSEINLGALLPKRASLTGTVLRGRPLEEKIALTRRFGREVLPWFENAQLRPVIDSRFDLADLGNAHRRMEANANIGKIALDL